MSYNVAVIIPPLPADDVEAWNAANEIIAEDRKEKKPRPEVFQKLYDRLTAKFPCICSVPDDQVDDTVWSDGPLINNFLHRAAVLGMSSPKEALPFLIKTTDALGLV